MQGRQGQLGAEGFFMGATYVVFSLSLCFLIYAAPRVPNSSLRRMLSATALMVAAFTQWHIWRLWQFKTAFAARNFFW